MVDRSKPIVLEKELRHLSAVARIDRRTKVFLLNIHAAKVVFASLLICAFGAPAAVENVDGTWVRAVLSLLGVFAGGFLFLSIQLQNGSKARAKLEAVGLALVGLWDVLIASSIIFAAILYPGPWVAAWSFKELPVGQPRLFDIIVYLSLATMVWTVHLSAALLRVSNPLTSSDSEAAAKALWNGCGSCSITRVLDDSAYVERLYAWGLAGWAKASEDGSHPEPPPLPNLPFV